MPGPQRTVLAALSSLCHFDSCFLWLVLLSRTPVLAIALVVERSRSWVIDYPAVITAAAGARGGGNPPDRDRTPRGVGCLGQPTLPSFGSLAETFE